jgi:hypothetical protein
MYKRWIWWVRMYMLSRDLHALPGPGGLFDQDWLYIEIFALIASVYVAEENRKLDSKVHQR